MLIEASGKHIIPEMEDTGRKIGNVIYNVVFCDQKDSSDWGYC